MPKRKRKREEEDLNEIIQNINEMYSESRAVRRRTAYDMELVRDDEGNRAFPNPRKYSQKSSRGNKCRILLYMICLSERILGDVNDLYFNADSSVD